MNIEKLNDMYDYCENFTGNYGSIEYLEKLERIARKIKEFRRGEMDTEQLIDEISDSKCPFNKDGDTIQGLCFTEPELVSPRQNKEIEERCLRCWKNFLEVE